MMLYMFKHQGLELNDITSAPIQLILALQVITYRRHQLPPPIPHPPLIPLDQVSLIIIIISKFHYKTKSGLKSFPKLKATEDIC